jgi:Sec-independent protein translocase protein TatA
MIKHQLSKFLLVGIVMLVFIACSGGKTEKIALEIPPELEGNPQATTLIGEMTDAVNECREASMKIARLTAKNNSGSLSVAESLKLGSISLGFAKAQEKMANCIRQAEEMGESLTHVQHSMLLAYLKNLESRSVEIDNPEALGMTPEEFEQFKNKDIAISNMPNQTEAFAEADSIDEYRGEASGFMDDDFNKGEVIEMPRFMHILFPILVIGLIVFLGIRRIKKFFGRTKELGYTISSTKSKISEAKEKLEQEGDKDSTEYQNAKKAIDFLNNITNKHNL